MYLFQGYVVSRATYIDLTSIFLPPFISGTSNQGWKIMIPDDSLNYQLLERNQMQDNLPHLPLPTPAPAPLF